MDVAKIGIDLAILTSNSSLLADAYSRGTRSPSVSMLVLTPCKQYTRNSSFKINPRQMAFGEMGASPSTWAWYTTATTAKTCKIYCLSIQFSAHPFVSSVNDLLGFELLASGTQFAANSDQQATFATLFDGGAWMIYRNVITGVNHWDFVSCSFFQPARHSFVISQSVLGRFISFHVKDTQQVYVWRPTIHLD